ncbi:type VI secretion system baseplate subunit TssE [Robbsia andropogonis]|uniref:type VI secretion system baseplate subunit TssE n=1 Tax=Robbsia andropogonis TaxID=28092 RepID=UPI00046547F8|nr:type VI secretion system baseplate subunit TssE [Robbsia andropogonis]
MSISRRTVAHSECPAQRRGAEGDGNAPRLLFDRLVSEDPGDAGRLNSRNGDPLIDDMRTPEKVRSRGDRPCVEPSQAWCESIANELSDLFQTTSRVPIRHYEARSLDLLDYGLPDIRGLSMRSEPDRQLLSRVMVLAITRFEPRLTDVHITLHADPAGGEALRLSIYARIRTGTAREDVLFVLTRSSQGLSRVLPVTLESEDDTTCKGSACGPTGLTN